MEIIKSYKDLCEDIEMWKWRVEAYKAEIEALSKLAKVLGPGEVKGIDYSQPRVQGTRQIGVEEFIFRLRELQNHIYIHEEAISRMEESRKQMEKRIGQLEGLDRQVVYMRDIEGKTLVDIADELGYGYDWIRKISARNPKKATVQPQTSDK